MSVPHIAAMSSVDFNERQSPPAAWGRNACQQGCTLRNERRTCRVHPALRPAYREARPRFAIRFREKATKESGLPPGPCEACCSVICTARVLAGCTAIQPRTPPRPLVKKFIATEILCGGFKAAAEAAGAGAGAADAIRASR